MLVTYVQTSFYLIYNFRLYTSFLLLLIDPASIRDYLSLKFDRDGRWSDIGELATKRESKQRYHALIFDWISKYLAERFQFQLLYLFNINGLSSEVLNKIPHKMKQKKGDSFIVMNSTSFTQL